MSQPAGQKGKQAPAPRWSALPAPVLSLILRRYELSLPERFTSWVNFDGGNQSQMLIFLYERALELAKLRKVSRAWRDAVNRMPFWSLLHDWLILTNSRNKSTTPTFSTVLPHLHNTCIVSRVNDPACASGTFYSAVVTVRYLHHRPVRIAAHLGPGQFCGVCLRAFVRGRPDPALRQNADTLRWPGAMLTCGPCRASALFEAVRAAGVQPWKGMMVDPLYEDFIDSGTGTIAQVVAHLTEKQWYLHHTDFEELLSQAREQLRLAKEERRHRKWKQYAGSDEDLEFDEEDELWEDDELWDDDDEDDDLEHHDDVRHAALLRWAHARIIEGFWLSPYEQEALWGSPSFVNAPARATLPPYPTRSLEMRTTRELRELHEELADLDLPPPGTMELANEAYLEELAVLVGPALRRIVQGLLDEMETIEDAKEAAARQTAETLLAFLQQEEAWCIWVTPKQPEAAPATAPLPPARTLPPKLVGVGADAIARRAGSPTSSPTSTRSSSRSSPPHSHTHSPSSYTPSPPTSTTPPLPPKTRRFISKTIPAVPLALDARLEWTRRGLMRAWEAACEPLYKCRCRICERAERAWEAGVKRYLDEERAEACGARGADGEGGKRARVGD